jgi:hypothetical protein
VHQVGTGFKRKKKKECILDTHLKRSSSDKGGIWTFAALPEATTLASHALGSCAIATATTTTTAEAHKRKSQCER